jgi:hypothetical protein
MVQGHIYRAKVLIGFLIQQGDEITSTRATTNRWAMDVLVILWHM